MKTKYMLLLALGWLLVLSVNTAMAAPPVQNNAGREYTVQPGDCLATIAKRFLGGQRFWPAILQATNMRAITDERFALIRNPHLIYGGQTLWLPNPDEAEWLLPQAGPQPAPTVNGAATGLLAVDINYIGDWYRDTFGYSKAALNIRHFAVIMPAAQYQKNPHEPGQICSQLNFPVGDEPLQFRPAAGETNWDLSVLHPVPIRLELEPGPYYVGGCFIAAPLSRQEAGAGDDVILYAGITGGGVSSDYQVVTIEPGGQKEITIILTDNDGWACPWVYLFNGTAFERRGEILRNLNSKNLETTQRHSLGPTPVQGGVIRLQIREEKPETSYLDALYLEVDGVPAWPDVGLLRDVDGQYLVLQQGDAYELTFDVSALAGNEDSVDIVVVSAGYYKGFK